MKSKQNLKMKRYLGFGLLVFCLLFFPAWIAAQQSQIDEAAALYQRANDMYQKGDYEPAIAGYRKILADGLVSSEIHYNLGVAYFRTGQNGRAILHFRRALELSPRDPEVRFNLDFVRKQAVDKIDAGFRLREFLLTAADWLSDRERYFFFFFASLLFWGFAALRLFFRQLWTRSVQKGLFVFYSAAVFIFLMGFLRVPFGVVTVSETGALSGPNLDNVVLFRLHAGAEFYPEELHGEDWVRISLADGKRGWLRRGDSVLSLD